MSSRSAVGIYSQSLFEEKQKFRVYFLVNYLNEGTLLLGLDMLVNEPNTGCLHTHTVLLV
jgi:hypothetical protein